MVAKRYRYNGRSQDLALTWLTQNHGEKWEKWRKLMSSWIDTQPKSTSVKLFSLSSFFLDYLIKSPQGHNPEELFRASEGGVLLDLAEVLSVVRPGTAIRTVNHIVDFIDWIIEHQFSELDDRGRRLPLAHNPFSKIHNGGIKARESVYTPLPYTFIKELREILCPKPYGDYSDWSWAQRASGQDRAVGDWFEVDESLIDLDDPDCVWRTRTVSLGKKYELWSPVRATALLIKLHLPLRTYQVRFLDSGEADTWRYKKGGWEINQKHQFKKGSEKNPWSKGAFRRIYSHQTGEIMTGLFISTNKTADQNKEERERGYSIPWQNTEVLYWLEKLRNWQEKYNPIDQPTPCTDLQAKHFGTTKSEDQKQSMGDFCFLFRDASGKGLDRYKPVSSNAFDFIWYHLLNTLEDKVAGRGQTLSDGSRLRFVKEYSEGHASKKATEFPLHSLRVSLLTCYAIEGQVPLPVLSKLLAGHSRMLMTLYYTKPTPSLMTDMLDDATARIGAEQDDSLRIFLRDADLDQIKSSVAYHDEGSMKSAIANRNPVGWEHRHIGLCLVGGNNVKSDEMSTIGGCWNGGELISKNIYSPVPNGPENCIRCRWFVTDARYLDALRAQFNNQSYKASLAANLAIELEQLRDALLDARYLAVEEGRPFLQQHELQKAERRHEKQLVLADQYAQDMVATFQLIVRVVTIEENRDNSDNNIKLVAVGSMKDIHQPISFIESNSELLQLAQICEDSEVYPDLTDDLRKTPAIEKRSRLLNNWLVSHNYTPVFMQMDERMQLIAGNAMLREMSRKASPQDQFEGFRYVTGVMEAGQYLEQLPYGIKALEDIYGGPVLKLSQLINNSPMELLELNDD